MLCVFIVINSMATLLDGKFKWCTTPCFFFIACDSTHCALLIATYQAADQTAKQRFCALALG